jgi:hypothetical protein
MGKAFGEVYILIGLEHLFTKKRSSHIEGVHYTKSTLRGSENRDTTRAMNLAKTIPFKRDKNEADEQEKLRTGLSPDLCGLC